METEHFQALFDVMIFGSIQIENNQLEKPSTKELTAWLLSKLHVIRIQVQTEDDRQTERFRESSCKHC